MINPTHRTQFRVDMAKSENSCECTRSRREFIKRAFVAGVGFPFAASAATDPADASARPKAGDRLVFAESDHEGIEIKPADLLIGAAQVQAWPMDPSSKTVRSGSRLNRVLLVRFEPATLDDETRAHAADGIVAYSSVCTHAQCFVTGWNQEQQVLHCPCHQSDYDPRHNAKVVAGPAPRALPALPLKIVDEALMATGPFLGRVGMRPG